MGMQIGVWFVVLLNDWSKGFVWTPKPLAFSLHPFSTRRTFLSFDQVNKEREREREITFICKAKNNSIQDDSTTTHNDSTTRDSKENKTNNNKNEMKATNDGAVNREGKIKKGMTKSASSNKKKAPSNRDATVRVKREKELVLSKSQFQPLEHRQQQQKQFGSLSSSLPTRIMSSFQNNTIATTTTTTTSIQTTTTTKTKTAVIGKSRNSNKNKSSSWKAVRQMLQHDILTPQKEREHALALYKSNQYRKDIQFLLQLKEKERQQQREEQLEINHDYSHWEQDVQQDDDDEEDDDRDLSDMLMTTTLDRQDLQQLTIQSSLNLDDNYDDDMTFMFQQQPLNVPFYDDGQPDPQLQYHVQKHRFFQTQIQAHKARELPQFTPPSPFDNNNKVNKNNNNGATAQTVFDELDDSLLSDNDIIFGLGLEGGRDQLKKILWTGVMAQEELIRCNIRLVYSIVKMWPYKEKNQKSSESGAVPRPTLDEVMQDGIIGLSLAVQRFDPTRQLRLSTYATPYITDAVRRCFQRASTGSIQFPHHQHVIKNRYRKIVNRYRQRQETLPDFDTLAKETGMSPDRLGRLLHWMKPPLSLDQTYATSGSYRDDNDNNNNNDGAESIAESIPSKRNEEDDIELTMLRQCLERIMSTELLPHERDIVRLGLGLDDGVPKTARQVHLLLGGAVSQSQIRVAQQRAYYKIKTCPPHLLETLVSFLDGPTLEYKMAKVKQQVQEYQDSAQQLQNYMRERRIQVKNGAPPRRRGRKKKETSPTNNNKDTTTKNSTRKNNNNDKNKK